MTQQILLEDIRPCFEGAVPATILTCSADGVINITFLSHVYHIDSSHVALSAQFFNKTKKNLEENPFATTMVMDPLDLTQYLLELEYLHTETEGSIFDSMKQKLEGIAAVTGMETVFKLRGADVYRVLSCTAIKPEMPLKTLTKVPTLKQVSCVLQVINQSHDMECMFDHSLRAMEDELGYEHTIIFIKDHHLPRLYTVASRGYGVSGAGSEVDIGEGVVGMVAASEQALRFTNMERDLTMSQAIQKEVDISDGSEPHHDLKVPLPGLEHTQSVVAVPLQARGNLLGVLYIESENIMAYFDADMNALTSIAQNLAMALAFYQSENFSESNTKDNAVKAITPRGELVRVRYFEANHSVFIDSDYLIKGVAGCILWKLLHQWQEAGQTEFTNKELRHDPDINLPDIGDNLEARLILLRKRLEDKSQLIRLEKNGRGRFRLVINQPVELQSIAAEKNDTHLLCNISLPASCHTPLSHLMATDKLNVFYLIPITIESGPTRCSTFICLKPACRIHPLQSAPV